MGLRNPGKNGEGNLLRRDGADMDAGGSADSVDQRRLDAVLDQDLFQFSRLSPTGDDGDVRGPGRNREVKGVAVSHTLRGNNDETRLRAQGEPGIEPFHDVIRVGEQGDIVGQGDDGDGEAQALGEVAQRARHQGGADDHKGRARQHRLDQHFDDAAGGADAVEVLDAIVVIDVDDLAVLGAHSDHSGLTVDQGPRRRLPHRPQRAAAADPTDNRAVAANDRLGAGLGRGAAVNVHHRRHRERLFFALHPRHAVDDVVRFLGHLASKRMNTGRPRSDGPAPRLDAIC